MAIDLTKTTYTITSIDQATGNIKVTFDCDGKPQCLSGAPLDDADALKSFVSDYLSAYTSGLQSTAVTVDKDVTALVGVKQAADTED